MKFSDWLAHINSIDTGIPGVNYSEFVRELFRPLPPAAMMTHAVLGMVTEHHEARTATDSKNFLEECGDYLFFLIAATQQVDFDDFDLDAMAPILLGIEKQAEDTAWGAVNEADKDICTFAPMLDISKRWLAYDRAPDTAAATLLVQLSMLGMSSLRSTHEEVLDRHPSEILRANVAKLRHRYKGGFSTEQAINRDTAGEMNAVSTAVPGA